MTQTTAQPCGRDGCGADLLCHRPDCPLVTINIGLGLTRIMTRAAFVSGLQAFMNRSAENV